MLDYKDIIIKHYGLGLSCKYLYGVCIRYGCMNYYKVKYIRLLDLLIELQEAARNNTLPKALKKYINPRLLIINEWLLSPMNDEETKLIFELIHKRRKKSSTIFCSHFFDDGWYERIGSEDNPLSDSIMDRIKYDAYKINIQAIDVKHDRSMREVYDPKSEGGIPWNDESIAVDWPKLDVPYKTSEMDEKHEGFATQDFSWASKWL